jgi:hypothetical protein
MEISIKNTLKKLRHSKEVTQEQLAIHLGVTSQSVGKWERGEGFPDITMLPSIALYFGVTVDELLGIDKLRITEKIEQYKKKSYELRHNGKVHDNFELWKKAYREFPEEHRVQEEYMNALYSVCSSEPVEIVDGVMQSWAVNLKEKGAEILSVGDHLLETCTDRDIVNSAVQIMCYTAYHMGLSALAKEYAEKLGSVYTSKEEVLAVILSGREGIEQAQNNLLHNLERLTMSVSSIRVKMAPSAQEQEKFDKLIIELWKLVLGEKDLGFYHCRVADAYLQLSVSFAVQQKYDDCLRALENMVRHSVASDTQKNGVYTQPWLKGKSHITYTSKNYSSNESYLHLDHLNNPVYDPIRQHPRFKSAVRQLKSTAKEIEG